MKVTMVWHGGSNYSNGSMHSSAELFDSIQEAKSAFRSRLHDSYYPCVGFDEGTHAFLYVGHYDPTAAEWMGDCSPDYVLEFSPDEYTVRQARMGG